MLDQNTDRMWYVIGAVLIGAAIVLILNGSVPDLFGQVASTYEEKTEEATGAMEAVVAGESTGGQHDSLEGYLLSTYGTHPNLEHINITEYEYVPENSTSSVAEYSRSLNTYKKVTASDLLRRPVKEIEVNGVALKHFGNSADRQWTNLPLGPVSDDKNPSAPFVSADVVLVDPTNGSIDQIAYYEVDSVYHDIMKASMTDRMIQMYEDQGISVQMDYVTVNNDEHLKIHMKT